MRIIAGRFKGRRIKAVPSHRTRPTTDRVKESLFNILGPYFKGGSFLDLFAGSGSVGIEAASRGIQHVALVDNQYAAYRTILSNVNQVEKGIFSVYKSSAKAALKYFARHQKRFNYVYLDPPYRLQRMLKDLRYLDRLHLLQPKATVVCETNALTRLPKIVDGYRFVQQKKYGITLVTVYQSISESGSKNENRGISGEF